MIFIKMKQSSLFICIPFYLAYFQPKLSSGYYHAFNSDFKLKVIINETPVFPTGSSKPVEFGLWVRFPLLTKF